MMTRRDFIEHTGAFAAVSAVGIPQERQAPQRYKMGLQLFTVRGPMARDAAGTLAQAAAMGYEEVETYGFDAQGIGYYGMPAKAFADLLRANRMTSPSGHYDLNRYAGVPLPELDTYVDRCIEGAKAVGHSYITWPLIDAPFRTPDKIKDVVSRLNRIGARIQKAGLQLAYHNHDFEFVEQDGRMAYDTIITETDPALVKLQIDLYWVAHGGKVTPHELFVRQPGRFVMWHVKDMHKVSRDYTELGNGTIDFTRIWPDAALSGMRHFFVEQGGNFTHDPMRSIADSAEYVKRVLLK